MFSRVSWVINFGYFFREINVGNEHIAQNHFNLTDFFAYKKKMKIKIFLVKIKLSNAK